MTQINYKEEVLKVHEFAIAKRIYEDGGKPFWTILKCDTFKITDRDLICSVRCKTRNAAWEVAYNYLKQNGRI